MKQLEIGKIFEKSIEVLQFELPSDFIFIWKESTSSDAIICKDGSEIPRSWLTTVASPLKIFGNFQRIKEMVVFETLPPGSKVIGCSSSIILKINFKENYVQYIGDRKKRVVLIDDSPTIRKILRHYISTFKDWEIVAETDSLEEIPIILNQFLPDLITLDLHLENFTGLDVMKKFVAPKKIPAILITSQSKDDGSLVMDALEAGAIDYLQKPDSKDWETVKDDLLMKMESAIKAKWIHNVSSKLSPKLKIKASLYRPEDHIILIGSSTGGTQALEHILTKLPENIPPILVSQHIPAGFSKALADRLNKLCPFEIREAINGESLVPGVVYIAPGDHHIKISSNGQKIEVVDSDPVNRFRPSVDFMFSSVPPKVQKKIIATILTGMGKDGAKGMLELKKMGAVTIAQDEASCVVYGMPKAAIEIGGIDFVKPLGEIPSFWIELMSKK